MKVGGNHAAPLVQSLLQIKSRSWGRAGPWGEEGRAEMALRLKGGVAETGEPCRRGAHDAKGKQSLPPASLLTGRSGGSHWGQGQVWL